MNQSWCLVFWSLATWNYPVPQCIFTEACPQTSLHVISVFVYCMCVTRFLWLIQGVGWTSFKSDLHKSLVSPSVENKHLPFSWKIRTWFLSNVSVFDMVLQMGKKKVPHQTALHNLTFWFALVVVVQNNTGCRQILQYILYWPLV